MHPMQSEYLAIAVRNHTDACYIRTCYVLSVWKQTSSLWTINGIDFICNGFTDLWYPSDSVCRLFQSVLNFLCYVKKSAVCFFLSNSYSVATTECHNLHRVQLCKYVHKTQRVQCKYIYIYILFILINWFKF